MELNVFIDGRSSNGMTYGAVFEFQMDNVVATSGDGTTVSFDEMYGFISMPNLGTLRFGQEDNAASLLQVRAPASAALGGDAEWDEFIVQTGLADSSPYIISGINDGNDATKIIYLSPQFAGFDFGLSYAANSGEGERTNVEGSTTSAQRDRTGLENEVSGSRSATAAPSAPSACRPASARCGPAPRAECVGHRLWRHRQHRPRAQDVNAYTVGAAITAYGFGFGAEYTWGQYRGASVGRTAINAGVDSSSHYIIGATYTMGPVVFGGVFGQGFQGNGASATRGTAAGAQAVYATSTTAPTPCGAWASPTTWRRASCSSACTTTSTTRTCRPPADQRALLRGAHGGRSDRHHAGVVQRQQHPLDQRAAWLASAWPSDPSGSEATGAAGETLPPFVVPGR